jgi:hypothetical protein
MGIRSNPKIKIPGSKIYITSPIYVAPSNNMEVIAKRNIIIKKLTKAMVAPISEIQLRDESGIFNFINNVHER